MPNPPDYALNPKYIDKALQDAPGTTQDGLRVIRAIVELNAASRPASVQSSRLIELYDTIQNDKPVKLTGKQAGFSRNQSGPGGERCGGCWHYFSTVGTERRQVQKGACEVVRPDDDSPSVNPEDYCRFAFTVDGETFPLREGVSKQPDKDEE